MALEYYKVTINASGLGGAAPADGLIDPTSADQYAKTAKVFSTVSSPTLTAGEDILINGYRVVFSSTTLSSLVNDINATTMYHGTTAAIFNTNYIRIQSAPGFYGQSITIAEGAADGALGDVGLAAGGYDAHPDVIGSSFTTLTNADTTKINNVLITFTSGGGLNLAGVISTINAVSNQTGVLAYPAGTFLRLVSTTDASISLVEGTAGVLAKLGMTAGTYEGLPTSLANARAKARANIRWDNVVKALSRDFNVDIRNIAVAGADVNTAPSGSTAVTFSVIANNAATLDESNAGVTLYTTAAIRRSIARALINDYSELFSIFDPTTAAVPPGKTGVRTEYITAQKLAANLTAAEATITVGYVSLNT